VRIRHLLGNSRVQHRGILNQMARLAVGSTMATAMKFWLKHAPLAVMVSYLHFGDAEANQPTKKAAVLAPQPSASAPTAWHWDGAAPKHQARPVEIKARALRCRFTYDARIRSNALECRNSKGQRIWGHDQTSTGFDGAALITDARMLYVAHFNRASTGCTVAAYELESGAMAWRRRLIGLGPIAHSEYLNDVQMQMVDGNLRVFGWESSGRYIEDVQPTTGASLATGLVDKNDFRVDATVPTVAARTSTTPSTSNAPPAVGAAKNVAFEFPGTTVRFNKAVAASDGQRTCTMKLDRDRYRTELRCSDKKQSAGWGIDLAEQFVPGGALAISGTTVLVARYCAISTGTTIDAYDLTTGAPLWHTQLYGVGPVGHSKYFNDVELRVAATGKAAHLIVSGFEAYGKYVEVLDIGSGAILGNRKVTP
jgi:hypothetical protein